MCVKMPNEFTPPTSSNRFLIKLVGKSQDYTLINAIDSLIVMLKHECKTGGVLAEAE